MWLLFVQYSQSSYYNARCCVDGRLLLLAVNQDDFSYRLVCVDNLSRSWQKSIIFPWMEWGMSLIM